MRNAVALLLVLTLPTGACRNTDTPPPPAATTTSPSGSAPSAAATPSLAHGDTAPAFSLEGSDGKAHALADHAGKEVVVVAWFPKAFTGG